MRLSRCPSSDLENAEQLAERSGADIRYVSGKGFLTYTEGRFCRDSEALRVTYLAGRHAAAISERAMASTVPGKADAVLRQALRYSSEKAIRSAVSLLKTLPSIHTSAADLNHDPLLFNVSNGTVDLRTGNLLPHSRSDLITQISPVVYDARAECPQWRQFLEKICADVYGGAPRPEIEALLQRIAGYLLTGDCSEQVIFFFLGDGANGKTTLVEVLSSLMGDYATTTSSETFMRTRSDQHPAAIADIAESRFVFCGELSEDARINEERLKSMTGEERRKARFMRENFFEFIPKFKIVFGTNHLPEIPTTDRATWRRIVPLPFSVVIPKDHRERGIKRRLCTELPGILNWAIEGCRIWQERKIDPLSVPAVKLLAEDYHEEEDHVTRILHSICEFAPGVWVSAHDLYRTYRRSCRDIGGTPLTINSFGRRLKLRFAPSRNGQSRIWSGLRLKSGIDVPGDAEVLQFPGGDVVSDDDDEVSGEA